MRVPSSSSSARHLSWRGHRRRQGSSSHIAAPRRCLRRACHRCEVTMRDRAQVRGCEITMRDRTGLSARCARPTSPAMQCVCVCMYISVSACLHVLSCLHACMRTCVSPHRPRAIAGVVGRRVRRWRAASLLCLSTAQLCRSLGKKVGRPVGSEGNIGHHGLPHGRRRASSKKMESKDRAPRPSCMTATRVIGLSVGNVCRGWVCFRGSWSIDRVVVVDHTTLHGCMFRMRR